MGKQWVQRDAHQPCNRHMMEGGISFSSLSRRNPQPGRTHHCGHSAKRRQRVEDVQREVVRASLITSEGRMSLHGKPLRVIALTSPPTPQSRVGDVAGNKEDSGFTDVSAMGFKLLLATSGTWRW